MVGRLAAWLPAGDGGKLSQALRTALLLAAAAGSPAALGAAADWEPQGPSTATVLALEADPGTRGRFLAGTYFGGLYETRNGGASWSPIPTEFSTFSVFAIAFDIRFPSTVYAGTFNGGVYKSQDGGRTWRAVNEGLQDRNVLALAVDPYQPSGVLALTGTGLYRSADAGEHWAAVEIEPLRGVGMRCIAFDPRKPGWVYLGSEGKGVFRSRDGGITWEQFAEGMGDQSVNSLAFSNQSKRKLYASTSQGYAFKLLPEETTWRKLSIWPGEPPGQVRYVLPHPATINVLYAATDAGVYLSLDDGSSWTLRLPQIASMVKSDVFGETFFAVNVAGGLQYTADLGRTWKGSQDGLQNIFVGALAVVQDQGLTTVFAGTEHGVFSRAGSNAAWRLPTMERRVFALLPDANQRGTLLAGTEGHGVWMTNDGGETWRQTSAGMVPPFVYSIDSSRQGSSRLYAGTSAGLFRSTDHGQNWTPLTELVVAKALSVSIDPADSNVAYIGSLQGSVFKTTTGGLNFFAASNGLPATEDIRFLQVSPLFSNRVYALTSGGRLFATDNAAGEWFDLRPGHTDALSLAIDPDQPWILYLGTAGNGVLRSTNSGSEWERIENALTARFAASLAVDPRNTSRIYAGTDDGVFLSSDGGQSWSQARAGLPSGVVAQVLVDPGSQTVFAALAGGGVYRSRDQGASWEPLPGGPSSGGFSPLGIDSAIPGTLFVGIPYQGLYTFDDTNGWQQRSSGMSLFVRGLAADAADPNVFYAGSLTGGVFKSVDRGESWRSVGLQDKVILSLQADPVNSGVVYAGTSDGVVKTTDGGNSWRQLGQKVHFAFSFLMDPRDRRRMLVGGSAGSLYRSQDGGTSWSYAGGGLPPRNIYALMIHPESGTIIAALDGAGLFRSSDEGHTWSAMPVLGADGGAVTQLAMDSSGGALLAATNGSGVLISLDGENWAPFNEGLGSLVVTSVVSSAAAPGRLLAATGDRGIFRSDSGRAWEPLEGPAAEITFLAIGPGGKLYAGSGAALFCSTDDGTTWRRIGAGLPEEPGGSGETSGSGGPAPVLRRVRVDPFDPNVVYAIVDHHGIFKSSDAGESFSRLLPALAGTPFNDVGIGENSSQVYAATLGQGIMASRDGGATWTNPADRRTIQPFVLSMAVNPQNPSILYAGTNFGVIKSADGGDSWSVASEGIGTLTVLAMAINPLQPEVLYAGTIQGVFESVDGGNHWAPLGGSMFHTNVTSLALSPGDYKTVYAGTEGGGVFRYVVP